jgi:hypothetical protein
MSDKINWTNVTAKLGDLKPWDSNPKTSTKKDARALLKSWDELGQFQTVAIGPGGEVYDGHQRLSALLTVHGAEYEIEARQSDRPLTDEERRKIALYSRQIGQWDWDALSSWQPAELMEWGGFDADTLKTWKRDTAALMNFLGSEDAGVIGDYGDISKDDRGGSSPWDRVTPSGKLRCIIGDVEFGLSESVVESWLSILERMEEKSIREAAEKWFTQNTQ